MYNHGARAASVISPFYFILYGLYLYIGVEDMVAILGLKVFNSNNSYSDILIILAVETIMENDQISKL